jgi:hypothetical protein
LQPCCGYGPCLSRNRKDMKLGKVELKQLNARCDAALKRRTFKGQIGVMDTWLNVDIKALPSPLRAKFRRVLKAMAYTTIMGPLPKTTKPT